MKIDTNKIPGYADMTVEEKLAALEAYETEDVSFDDYVRKDIYNKKASEAAELSKKLKAKMTEDEQIQAERAAQAEAIRAELEHLRKEKAISEHKASYIALGYDEKLAGETAQALVSGEMDKVFANQKRFIENVRKIERAEALASGSDKLPSGAGEVTVTREQFRAMGYTEKAKLFEENRELYESLQNGGIK